MLQHDDQKVKDYGVKLAVETIRTIISNGDVKGVHFCTLNLERSVRKVLDGLGWTRESQVSGHRLIIVRVPLDSLFRVHLKFPKGIRGNAARAGLDNTTR